MKEKIKNQKGFIQTPLLIAIIVFIVIVATLIVHGPGSTTITTTLTTVPPSSTTIIEPSITTTLKNIPKKQSLTEEELSEIKLTADQTRNTILGEQTIIKDNSTTITTTTIPPTTTTTTTTTTEPPTTTTTQEETYAYHDYYPIILSLSDNYGNIIRRSGYNSYRGSYSDVWPTRSLKIGDEVRIKVETSDPKNRPILYLWDSTNEHFRQEFNNWTSNNEINYTITQETLKNSGELFRIVVSIKSEKEYFRNTSGVPWDDEIFIDYSLVPLSEQ